MIKFNISASSYSLFKQSPLVFYFQYIAKSKPDTKVNTVYGMAGTIVHNLLDKYNEDNSINIYSLFDEKWIERNLHIINGFGNAPLNKESFKNGLKAGKELLNNVYNIIGSEERIVLPFVSNDKFEIKLKGIIDFVAKKDNNIIIGDWKTNSTVSDFSTHAKMYALLYWKKYNIFPKELIYEYLRINKTKNYTFTKEEILLFEQELKDFANKIKLWGDNVDNYELGNINSPFNCHKKKCLREKFKRGV